MVASVPAKVNELLTVRVLPSAIVSVDPVAGAVNVNLLMVPGSVKTDGSERVHVPVDVIVQVPEAVIWLAVPATITLVTVPLLRRAHPPDVTEVHAGAAVAAVALHQ